VLCADKRATSGYLITNKKFDKIVTITDDIVITTAGTVSDVQLLTKLIRAELKLKSIRTGKEIMVKEAVNLLATMVYNNIRKLSLIPGISHFLVGGKDSSGFYAYDVGADGSVSPCDDFISSGSGSVMAFGVSETLYRKNMSVEEGVKLGVKSVSAAIQRDIASGEGVDVVTVTRDGVKKVFTKEIDTKVVV
jgi:proteasome beta subunit